MKYHIKIEDLKKTKYEQRKSGWYVMLTEKHVRLADGSGVA